MSEGYETLKGTEAFASGWNGRAYAGEGLAFPLAWGQTGLSVAAGTFAPWLISRLP